MDQTDRYAIELRGIDKRFGEVYANKQIDLKVRKGSIHGIVGENGAGKSTLMSIIYGFYHADKGEMFFDGNPFKPHGSQDAIAAGVGMVHQHFMLVNNFTVLENVILGAENGWHLGKSLAARKAAGRTGTGLWSRSAAAREGRGSAGGPATAGRDPQGALSRRPHPDPGRADRVLTPQEADHLFEVLKKLRDQGATIILITHKLREILAITDQVSIMRRGEMVAHVATKDTDKEQLAELMVGRKVRLLVDKGRPSRATPSSRSMASAMWTTPGWSGSNPSASRCGPVKWSASPASPATASPSCSACSAASSNPARAASPSPAAVRPTK